MGKPGKRKRGQKGNADDWARWQLLASITRIRIEILQPLLDRFIGDGPGRLL